MRDRHAINFLLNPPKVANFLNKYINLPILVKLSIIRVLKLNLLVLLVVRKA